MTTDVQDRDEATTPLPKKARRGFAAMDPEKQREIARKGSKQLHKLGKAHHFTADEARLAGLKGGAKVSLDRAHMAEIGRKGGLARRRNAQEAPISNESAEPRPPTSPRDLGEVE